MQIIKIIVVGAGGIGSYFCQYLYEIIQKDQISIPNFRPEDLLRMVHVYDFDSVDNKNILYQNFITDDVFLPKSLIMSQRYGFLHSESKINVINTTNFDFNDTLVVSCVDNAAFRRALFNSNHCMWIDLRSTGTRIAYYVKSPKNTKEYMLSTLPVETDKEVSGSCQLQNDINQGIIQLGNKIIAQIGAQLVLNIFRNKRFNTRLSIDV